MNELVAVVDAELGEGAVEVPSTVRTATTSRAVDALSITPPGDAADSIRCAMPTGSPMVV